MSQSRVNVEIVESVTSDMPRKRRFCRNLGQICCLFNLESQDELIERYFLKQKTQSRASSHDYTNKVI
jgi:hypothetical protein